MYCCGLENIGRGLKNIRLNFYACGLEGWMEYRLNKSGCLFIEGFK